MFDAFFPETSTGRFYVYILYRPDDRPFYVGKGCGDRIKHHEREARNGHDCHKCRVIRKIWQGGGQVDRQIVFNTDDEYKAFQFEARLIARFRQQLTNVLECDPSMQCPARVTREYKTKEERQREHIGRACQMIRILDHEAAQALRRRDIEYAEKLDAEIEAYRLWTRPPIQLELEGFEHD